MLLTRISQPPPSSPTPEDIFSSALTTIFTDDIVNSHGTPGSYVTYRSPKFGDLELHIPAHPDEEDGRKLFAHYLWNAAVLAADAIEVASNETEDVREAGEEEPREWNGREKWEKMYWNLRGKRVLELGAGTALPSLIAALSGARSCTITDHPSSPALTTGAIEKNVKVNISQSEHTSPEFLEEREDQNVTETQELSRTKGAVQVLGYTWGTSAFYLPSKYGKPAPSDSAPEFFDRVIVADCLWMPSQHINLIKTILQFLPPKNSGTSCWKPSLDSGDEQGSHDKEANNVEQALAEESFAESHNVDEPCALVIAGFHTGRRIVSDFFSLATDPQPPSQLAPAHSDDTASSGSLNTDGNSSLLNDNAGKPELPDPATTNTISLDPSALTSSERSVCGLLRLASISEVDVDGNTRAWQKERSEEGKWEAKKWCVVGVFVRR